jgi:hypothetical protein
MNTTIGNKVEVQNVLIASGNIGDTMTDYDITQGIWYNDTYIGTLGVQSVRITITVELNTTTARTCFT